MNKKIVLLIANALLTGQCIYAQTNTDSIKTLEIQRKKRFEADVKAQSCGLKHTSGFFADDDSTVTRSFASKKGHLPMPADSYIKAENSLANHSDTADKFFIITCTPGTHAISIDSGKVTTVLQISNAGQAILVRHGNYISVYTPLDAVSVKMGQEVKQGEILGTIQTTNDETMLEFQLWQGKENIPAAEWFNTSKSKSPYLKFK